MALHAVPVGAWPRLKWTGPLWGGLGVQEKAVLSWKRKGNPNVLRLNLDHPNVPAPMAPPNWKSSHSGVGRHFHLAIFWMLTHTRCFLWDLLSKLGQGLGGNQVIQAVSFKAQGSMFIFLDGRMNPHDLRMLEFVGWWIIVT